MARAKCVFSPINVRFYGHIVSLEESKCHSTLIKLGTVFEGSKRDFRKTTRVSIEMGAGLWFISCVQKDNKRVHFKSKAPWKELAELRREYGDSNVTVNVLDGSADVASWMRVEDAPTEDLDTGLTTFIAFMEHFQEVATSFSPYFAWDVRGGWRGVETRQILSSEEAARTLACWDDVMKAVFADFDAEFGDHLEELDIGVKFSTQRFDYLRPHDFQSMKEHLDCAKTVLQFACLHGMSVDIKVTFD